VIAATYARVSSRSQDEGRQIDDEMGEK